MNFGTDPDISSVSLTSHPWDCEEAMRHHVWCIDAPGDTHVTARLYTAIASGCIPVILVKGAFGRAIDYRSFAVFVDSSDFLVDPEVLVRKVGAINASARLQMQKALLDAQDDVLWSGRIRAVQSVLDRVASIAMVGSRVKKP